MKNISDLATKYDVEKRSLIKKYSTELGKQKGGIVKCELGYGFDYNEYWSILDAVNNEYVLAERIIHEFVDGNTVAIVRDHFYAMAYDFYNLPVVYEMLSTKGRIPEYRIEQFNEIIGLKKKKEIRARKPKERTPAEELLIKKADLLTPNCIGIYRCNIYDYYKFGYAKDLKRIVSGDYCLLSKIISGFEKNGHITVVYDNIYVINKSQYSSLLDKNGDRCLPRELRIEIRTYLEHHHQA